MFALATKIKSTPAVNKAFIYATSVAFLLICANTKIYLPISPVPITMHTFAIAMLGCLLPFRVALSCYLVYFLEGMLGSPLFGMPLGFGPSFGYFIGMMVSLFFLSQVSQKAKMPLIVSLIASSLIIWSFGVLHLQHLVGLKMALVVGIVPFIIGDAFKLVAAYSLITLAKKRFKSFL